MVFWIAAVFGGLVLLESRPPVARRVGSAKLTWESPYERVSALFAPDDAPFVAHWFRFYVRNNRFRAMYLLSLPLVAFLTFNMSRRGGDDALFVAALGTFPIVTFLGTSRMAVNQYGYVGGGLRRYSPCPPTRGPACGRAPTPPCSWEAQ